MIEIDHTRGHKIDVMLALYGDHEIDGDRELIQEKFKEAFAKLLPEPAAEAVSIASEKCGSPPGGVPGRGRATEPKVP